MEEEEQPFVEREPFYLFDDEKPIKNQLLSVRLAPDVLSRLLRKVEQNPLAFTRHELVAELSSNWKSLKKYEKFARASEAIRFHYIAGRRGYVYKVGDQFDEIMKHAKGLDFTQRRHL